MAKIYLSFKEYDAVIDALFKHGYDNIFDKGKETFRERLDKVVDKKRG